MKKNKLTLNKILFSWILHPLAAVALWVLTVGVILIAMYDFEQGFILYLSIWELLMQGLVVYYVVLLLFLIVYMFSLRKNKK